MGLSEKRKGQKGETLAVQMMYSLGLENPRKGPNQRYIGAKNSDADVLCDSLDSYFLEVKHGYSNLSSLYDWLEKCEDDSSNTSRIPLILYKGDYKKFLAIGDAQYILPILSGHSPK